MTTTTPMRTVGVRCPDALIAAIDTVAIDLGVTKAEAARVLIERSLIAVLADPPVRLAPPLPPTDHQRETQRHLAAVGNAANQIAHALHRARLVRQGGKEALDAAVTGWTAVLAAVRQAQEQHP